MFGFSIWELLIVLAIVLAIFGASRFKNLGSDLGEAIKGFRTAIKDDPAESLGDGSADSAASAKQAKTAESPTDKPNV